MFTIGLTGNIGSGKSTVSRYLAGQGAVIIDADQVAREVVRPGTPALAEILAVFGSGVLNRAGSLDRKKLGAIVFSDPQAMARLNAITHPRIVAAVAGEKQKLANSAGAADRLLVIDAPLLIEVGLQQSVDEVWVVTVDEQQQIARLMARDGLSEEAARARIAAQMPQAEKLNYARRVIDNSGSPEETRKQVARHLAAIKKEHFPAT